jgi:hypothetical protein
MDKNFGRILSLERYKRNHLYFEALFSPAPISSLKYETKEADLKDEIVLSRNLDCNATRIGTIEKRERTKGARIQDQK